MRKGVRVSTRMIVPRAPGIEGASAREVEPGFAYSMLLYVRGRTRDESFGEVSTAKPLALGSSKANESQVRPHRLETALRRGKAGRRGPGRP